MARSVAEMHQLAEEGATDAPDAVEESSEEDELEALDLLSPQVEQFASASRTAIALAKKGLVADAQALLAGDVRAAYDTLDSGIQFLLEDARSELGESAREVAALGEETRLVAIGGLLLVLSLVAAVGIVT
jgi:hypothetical protein